MRQRIKFWLAGLRFCVCGWGGGTVATNKWLASSCQPTATSHWNCYTCQSFTHAAREKQFSQSTSVLPDSFTS